MALNSTTREISSPISLGQPTVRPRSLGLGVASSGLKVVALPRWPRSLLHSHVAEDQGGAPEIRRQDQEQDQELVRSGGSLRFMSVRATDQPDTRTPGEPDCAAVTVTRLQSWPRITVVADPLDANSRQRGRSGSLGQVTRSVAVRGSRWQPVTLLYSSAVCLIRSVAGVPLVMACRAPMA
jgi:hypothetical protein